VKEDETSNEGPIPDEIEDFEDTKDIETKTTNDSTLQSLTKIGKKDIKVPNVEEGEIEDEEIEDTVEDTENSELELLKTLTGSERNLL